MEGDRPDIGVPMFRLVKVCRYTLTDNIAPGKRLKYLFLIMGFSMVMGCLRGYVRIMAAFLNLKSYCRGFKNLRTNYCSIYLFQ